MSAGVAGRPLDGCNLCISGCVRSSSSGTGGLIRPGAARGPGGDSFVAIEIDDPLQCLAGSALLKVFGQRREPLCVLALQDDEFGDGVAPAPGAAASVGHWPVMDHPPGWGPRGAMAGPGRGLW